jgi:predicted outer membrane lipoprotein
LRTPRLVNNLNLKIVGPGGAEFFPYVMPFVGTWTEASMDSPATTGINNTDNVEQVRIASPPAAGTYQVVLTFSGALANNSQNYSLLISGSSADAPPPPPLALSSVTPNTGLSGATVTIDLTGASLRADTVIKLTRSGQSDIPTTGGQLIGETLRRQVDLFGAAAGAWNVVATNPNLETSTLAAAFTVIGAIWSENFDGGNTGWTSEATTGSNTWSLTTAQSQSPATSRFAPALSGRTTTNLISPSIPIPAGATNLQLKFWHNYNLEKVRNDGKDGGVLEFSVDGGAWFDVLASASGTSFASNGYTATIKTTGAPNTLSDINNRSAWSGTSGGWVETIVNFTNTAKFANKALRMRWRLVTDSDDPSTGWYVDSISLIGGGDLSNQTPVIATPASASTSDPIATDGYTLVRGTSSMLSVAATDDAGEPALTYTWALNSGPGSPVFFSTNGTNASKTTTANFEGTGDYAFMVSVRDTQGLTVTSAVDVRVLQTGTGIIVGPAATSLTVGAAQAFGATLLDQFSVPMASQPASFTWSASGGGTINTAGLFNATSAGGPFVITASNGGFSNTASVTVNPAPATITLGNLAHTYTGSQKAATFTTNPAGLAVALTYNGSSTAPTNAGSYAVEANITNPNYQGSSSGTLVIAPANAWVSWQDEHFTETEQAAGLTAKIADFDFDGLPNLSEYALGTDPRQFTPPLVAVRDGNGLALTFTRPANLSDVLYSAESSDALGNWAPVPLEVIVEGYPETLRARDPLTTGDPSKRFLRLRFESE